MSMGCNMLGDMNSDMDPFVYVDEKKLKKERDKARELRNSAWWSRKKSNGICYYCRQRFPASSLTMDHIIPLARGGKSVKENLVPCCKDCNNKKKNMLPVEWSEYLNNLKDESESDDKKSSSKN